MLRNVSSNNYLGKGRSHGGGGGASEATEPIASAIVKYNYQVKIISFLF